MRFQRLSFSLVSVVSEGYALAKCCNDRVGVSGRLVQEHAANATDYFQKFEGNVLVNVAVKPATLWGKISVVEC